MSDVCEATLETVQKQQEIELQAGIRKAAEVGEHNKLKPTHMCYFCMEGISDEHKLFCDADCREDWEFWLRQQRVKHGPGFPARMAYQTH